MITLQQIADKCGVNRDRVKNALYRKRKTLSEMDKHILQTAKINNYIPTSKTALERIGKLVYCETPCPKCMSSNWKVIETRHWNRIRMCLECNTRYWTREEIVTEKRYLK
jgi:transcriptional regulator NrdR family protein